MPHFKEKYKEIFSFFPVVYPEEITEYYYFKDALTSPGWRILMSVLYNRETEAQKCEGTHTRPCVASVKISVGCGELTHPVTPPASSPCSTSSDLLQRGEIIECPTLERTHKDHQFQLLGKA